MLILTISIISSIILIQALRNAFTSRGGALADQEKITNRLAQKTTKKNNGKNEEKVAP